MRLIDMFSSMIICCLDITFCAEVPNDLSTTDSIINLSFDNQNENKQSILTETKSHEILLNLINHVQNLNKLYKFINANKEQYRNEKLKINLDVFKIELLNVNNKFNQVNFLEFLNNSNDIIRKFIYAYSNEDDRNDAIVLHNTIEKFILELENIELVVHSLIKLNLSCVNLILIKYKLNPYKKQILKLKVAFSYYKDFLKKIDDNLIVNLNELSTKLISKFNKIKKSSSTSEVEVEKSSYILYNNVSDLYEKLIDYYNQEEQLSKQVFKI